MTTKTNEKNKLKLAIYKIVDEMEKASDKDQLEITVKFDLKNEEVTQSQIEEIIEDLIGMDNKVMITKLYEYDSKNKVHYKEASEIELHISWGW